MKDNLETAAKLWIGATSIEHVLPFASMRVALERACRAADIQTLGQLAKHGHSLWRLRGVGRKTVKNARLLVEAAGIEWVDPNGGAWISASNIAVTDVTNVQAAMLDAAGIIASVGAMIRELSTDDESRRAAAARWLAAMRRSGTK